MAQRIVMSVLTGGLCAAAFSALAHDHEYKLPEQSKNVETLEYVNNPPDFTYTMAWKVMQDIFDRTTHDIDNKFVDKPWLMVAKTDLNGDGQEDYIAYPVELTHVDENQYCSKDTSYCPHYVFTGTLEKPVLLGKIFANAIDVGDESINGYKTLKVFNREDESRLIPGREESFGYYDTYKFDPEKNTYVDALTRPKPGETAPKLENNQQ